MTNTYVVHDEQGHVLLIDPACSNAYEEQVLHAYIENLRLEHGDNSLQIVATHGHLDHLWGAAWATKQYGQPVMIAESDREMATCMQGQYDLFGIQRKAEAFPIANWRWGIENWKLDVIPTPGHTPGSVSLYLPEEKTVFSGDTLFRNGCGRTDLPGGNSYQLMESLSRLMTLPADTQVYPGHGETTTIEEEKDRI
ncbi:MAG: MBL fold metallo-hydrolase [Paludibacteraceae bacterium]|nr:MBL fold metallo-hydrolase [Paludibacteraceae bacterium]